MSWYRQVKSLFTVCSVMFFFIIYSIIGNAVLQNETDYKIYIAALTTVFMMQFIISKMQNKLLILGVPTLIMAVSIYMFEGINSIYNIIFVIFCTIVLYKYEDEGVSYELYKARGIKTIIIITVLGVFLPFLNPDLSKHILSFYILFLFCIILSLRETRAYSFRLRKKKLVNIVSLGGILLAVVFLDKISFIIFKIIKYAFQIIGFLMDKVIMLILYAAGYFVDKLIRVMSKLYRTGEIPKVLEKYLNGDEQNSSFGRKVMQDVPLPPVVSIILRTVLLILILIVLYKIIMWYKEKTTKNTEGFEEEKEKLTKNGSMKRGLLKNAIRSVFGTLDIKGQIFETYKRFQHRTNAMGLYKSYMTATQLGNLTKPEVDDIHAVDSLTKLYNETKFSNHDVEEQSLKVIKDNYNSIKKQLQPKKGRL